MDKKPYVEDIESLQRLLLPNQRQEQLKRPEPEPKPREFAWTLSPEEAVLARSVAIETTGGRGNRAIVCRQCGEPIERKTLRLSFSIQPGPPHTRRVGHLHFDPCEKSAELLEHDTMAAEVESVYGGYLDEYLADPENAEELRLKTSDEKDFSLIALPESKKGRR
jgi:hypothetical protein